MFATHETTIFQSYSIDHSFLSEFWETWYSAVDPQMISLTDLPLSAFEDRNGAFGRSVSKPLEIVLSTPENGLLGLCENGQTHSSIVSLDLSTVRTQTMPYSFTEIAPAKRGKRNNSEHIEQPTSPRNSKPVLQNNTVKIQSSEPQSISSKSKGRSGKSSTKFRKLRRLWKDSQSSPKSESLHLTSKDTALDKRVVVLEGTDSDKKREKKHNWWDTVEEDPDRFGRETELEARREQTSHSRRLSKCSHFRTKQMRGKDVRKEVLCNYEEQALAKIIQKDERKNRTQRKAAVVGFNMHEVVARMRGFIKSSQTSLNLPPYSKVQKRQVCLDLSCCNP